MIRARRARSSFPESRLPSDRSKGDRAWPVWVLHAKVRVCIHTAVVQSNAIQARRCVRKGEVACCWRGILESRADEVVAEAQPRGKTVAEDSVDVRKSARPEGSVRRPVGAS